MVARGFKNDNESRMPTISNDERRKVIAKVMARGGVVRRTLEAHGTEPNTQSWQGQSGVDIAGDLLVAAGCIEDVPGSTREKISLLARRFIDVHARYQQRVLDDHTEVS